MKENEFLKRIKLLEYHQQLLLKIITNPNLDFYKLIVEKGITEQEVIAFFERCDKLTIQMEEQKAEGFLYFYPLFNEFTASLPRKLSVNETVTSCLNQNLFTALMNEFKRCM